MKVLIDFQMDKLYRKCLQYQKLNLKVPPEPLVQKWGKSFGLSRGEIMNVSEGLELRHITGKWLPFEIPKT
jgi:hypothetical protein